MVALKILGYFVGFLIIVLGTFLAAGGYKTILAIPDHYVMHRVTARAEQFEHLYLANLLSIADQQDTAFIEINRFLDAFGERRTENPVSRFMVVHELEATQRSYFFITVLRILANIDSSMGDPLRVYWRILNDDSDFMTEFKADERWQKDYMFNIWMAAACAKFENPSSPRKWETVQSYWERALDAGDTPSRKLAIKRTLMLMHLTGNTEQSHGEALKYAIEIVSSSPHINSLKIDQDGEAGNVLESAWQRVAQERGVTNLQDRFEKMRESAIAEQTRQQLHEKIKTIDSGTGKISEEIIKTRIKFVREQIGDALQNGNLGDIVPEFATIYIASWLQAVRSTWRDLGLEPDPTNRDRLNLKEIKLLDVTVKNSDIVVDAELTLERNNQIWRDKNGSIRYREEINETKEKLRLLMRQGDSIDTLRLVETGESH